MKSLIQLTLFKEGKAGVLWLTYYINISISPPQSNPRSDIEINNLLDAQVKSLLSVLSLKIN